VSSPNIPRLISVLRRFVIHTVYRVVLLVAWASIGHQFCVSYLISTQRRTSEELDWVTRGVKLRGGLEHVSKLKPTRFFCGRLDAAFRRWSSRPISRCHTDHCHVTDTKVSELLRPSSSLAMVAFRYRFYLRVWLFIDIETRVLLYYSHLIHIYITRISSACYISGSLLRSSLHVDPHHPLWKCKQSDAEFAGNPLLPMVIIDIYSN